MDGPAVVTATNVGKNNDYVLSYPTSKHPKKEFRINMDRISNISNVMWIPSEWPDVPKYPVFDAEPDADDEADDSDSETEPSSDEHNSGSAPERANTRNLSAAQPPTDAAPPDESDDDEPPPLEYSSESESDEDEPDPALQPPARSPSTQPQSSQADSGSAHSSSDSEQEQQQRGASRYNLRSRTSAHKARTADSGRQAQLIADDLLQWVHKKQSKLSPQQKKRVTSMLIKSITKTKKFNEHMAMAAAKQKHDLETAPKNLREARARPDWPDWEKAMRVHIQEKLIEPGSFSETSLKNEAAKRKMQGLPPLKFNVCTGTWVFAYKFRAHANGKEKSARYCVRGFTQRHGVDYDETSADTTQLSSYFINEARAAQDECIERENWDVKGAFYRAIPSHVQLVRAPDVYHFKNPEYNLWLLETCIPGTKDAMHHYCTQFFAHLKSIGFKCNPHDPSSFYLERREGNRLLWISLTVHVDDVGVFSNSPKLCDEIFNLVNARYPLKRLKGSMGVMLGIDSERTPRGIEFHQPNLIDDIVKVAGVENWKRVSTPLHHKYHGFDENDKVLDEVDRKRQGLNEFPYRTLIGKLLYLRRCTRWDIAFAVSALASHQVGYGPTHVEALLHLCAYVKWTKDMKMVFPKGNKHQATPLLAFVDSSYAPYTSTRSITGYVVYLFGCPIACYSKKQGLVTLSSCESEYVAAQQCAKDVVFLRRLINGFGIKVQKTVPMLEDNQSAIMLSKKNGLSGPRTRHMAVRMAWLQERVTAKEFKLVYINTKEQVADVITKGASKQVHDALVPQLMGHATIYTDGVKKALTVLDKDEYATSTKKLVVRANMARVMSEPRGQKAIDTWIRNIKPEDHVARAAALAALDNIEHIGDMSIIRWRRRLAANREFVEPYSQPQAPRVVHHHRAESVELIESSANLSAPAGNQRVSESSARPIGSKSRPAKRKYNKRTNPPLLHEREYPAQPCGPTHLYCLGGGGNHHTVAVPIERCKWTLDNYMRAMQLPTSQYFAVKGPKTRNMTRHHLGCPNIRLPGNAFRDDVIVVSERECEHVWTASCCFKRLPKNKRYNKQEPWWRKRQNR